MSNRVKYTAKLEKADVKASLGVRSRGRSSGIIRSSLGAGARGGFSAPTIKIALSILAFLYLFLASPLSPLSAREAGKDEAREHLEKAEIAFRRGLELERTDSGAASEYFMKSVLHYRKLAEEAGISNGKLYYNIGNAYFRMDDLGRAILNYKRASLYMPNDDNLRKNLEYARGRRKSVVEEKEREKVLKTLFFLHYDLPYRVRFLIFTISFSLIWLVSSAYLFAGGPQLKTVIVVLSIISAAFLASVTVEKVVMERNPEGVIIEEEVTARKGDADTYQPSFTEPLSAGTEFRLVERRGSWWHVELEDGTRCWIPADTAETVI